MWITAFKKNEFLRDIRFSVHLFNQIRMQTFLEICAKFYNDYDSAPVYLFQQVKYQSLTLTWGVTFNSSCQK